MATIATAQAKWERKTSGKGDIWKQMVGAAGARYCDEFARFLGHRPTRACEAYNAGVAAVSAADFNTSIAGKGAKWAAKMGAVQ